MNDADEELEPGSCFKSLAEAIALRGDDKEPEKGWLLLSKLLDMVGAGSSILMEGGEI